MAGVTHTTVSDLEAISHVARAGPEAVRKVVPGPDHIRLLAIGGIPGEVYDASS